MECTYSGLNGDTGYTRTGYIEVAPSDARNAYGAFKGWVLQQTPTSLDQELIIVATKPRIRLDKYPWLP